MTDTNKQIPIMPEKMRAAESRIKELEAQVAEMQAKIDNANVKEAYADNFIVQIKCLTEQRDTLKAQLELATKKTLSPEECIEIAKAIIKYKYKGRFDLGEF